MDSNSRPLRLDELLPYLGVEDERRVLKPTNRKGRRIAAAKARRAAKQKCLDGVS